MTCCPRTSAMDCSLASKMGKLLMTVETSSRLSSNSSQVHRACTSAVLLWSLLDTKATCDETHWTPGQGRGEATSPK
eukprot:764240-Hanusia_phi.AAC.8